MANNPGVPGVGVTPLVDGAAVNGGNPLPVNVLAGGSGIKFAGIGPGTGLANGDNTIVAAVAGKKIRVLSISVDTGSIQLNAAWTSGPGGAEIYAGATGIIAWTESAPGGLMETAAGDALVLNISSPAAIGSAWVSYQEI